MRSVGTRIYERLSKGPRFRKVRWLVPIVVYSDPKLRNVPASMSDLVRPRTVPDAGE